MDQLCTEVVGLDGHGGTALYASVDQWLAAYENSESNRKVDRTVTPSPDRATGTPAKKPRKLDYREQREWDQMEYAILAAEQEVAQREAAVERAATAGHVALTDACRALEEAQRVVQRLYGRWKDLEAKRGDA